MARIIGYAAAALIATTPTVCRSAVSADSSVVSVEFACSYSGLYRSGEPYDYVTISPSGDGETFGDAGVTVNVCVKDESGQPVVGLPADRVWLTSDDLCLCAGALIADAPTDDNGCTQFTGRLLGAGHATHLMVIADGVELGDVPVLVNSASGARPSSADCFTSIDDFLEFRFRFGAESGDLHYAPAFDYDEDGFVDLTDLTVFSQFWEQRCTQSSEQETMPTARNERRSRMGSPRIGVFFDPLGQTNCVDVEVGEVLEFWVLAVFDERDVGIRGVECRLSGLRQEWAEIIHSDWDIVFGNLGVGHAAAWDSCKTTTNGIVEIARITTFLTEPVSDVVLRVEPKLPPSNRLFECPIVNGCDVITTCGSDRESKICATGLTAYVNPSDRNLCTVSVKSSSWGRIKRLYR